MINGTIRIKPSNTSCIPRILLHMRPLMSKNITSVVWGQKYLFTLDYFIRYDFISYNKYYVYIKPFQAVTIFLEIMININAAVKYIVYWKIWKPRRLLCRDY